MLADTRCASPRRRKVRLLLGLLVFVACGAGAGQDDARSLLRAMHDATRHLNYDGVFVYQRGNQLDTMRLVHAFDGERERERLISLSGPAREVIRDGTLVTCLFADDQAAMVEKNPPRELLGIGFSAPLETLLTNYRFAVAGSARIAGRDTQIVAVTPVHGDRYAYRLWIDRDSKLLLKSVILGRGDRLLEQVQFTQIELLEHIDPALLRPEIGGSGFTWRMDRDDDETEARESLWQVEWLPRGFALQENNVQHMSTSKMPVGHLVYSDGLAMVSVFIEELVRDEPPLQGYSARGAVNAFSRVAGDYQVTVVGEVPLPTVRRIAGSVTRAAATAATD